MTPQRWKGAGVVFLVVAALLIVAAMVSVLTAASATQAPLAFAQYLPSTANLFGAETGVLRGVVLGAFAGVAFFLGLACFVWSALAEAGRQRAEILAELVALRTRAEQTGQSQPSAAGPAGSAPA